MSLKKTISFHLGKFWETECKIIFQHNLPPKNSTWFLYVETRKRAMTPTLEIRHNVLSTTNSTWPVIGKWHVKGNLIKGSAVWRHRACKDILFGSEFRCIKRWWWSYCSHFTTRRACNIQKIKYVKINHGTTEIINYEAMLPLDILLCEITNTLWLKSFWVGFYLQPRSF